MRRSCDTPLRWASTRPRMLFVGLLAFLMQLVPTLTGQAADAEVTFTKDIAAILQRSCQNCHRPNSMAPMALLTYQDARPWSRSIKEKVVKRNMPPWFVDRSVGIHEFKDDPSLSEKEITTIATWVDNGTPEGNRADMP